MQTKNKKDYLKWKTNYWKNLLIRSGLHIAKDKTVLDAGCGPTGLFLALPDNKLTDYLEKPKDEKPAGEKSSKKKKDSSIVDDFMKKFDEDISW